MTAPFFQAELRLPARAALSVADLLQGLEAPQALSVEAFEIPGTDDFTIRALYREPPQTGGLSHAIAPLIEALELAAPAITIDEMQDRDWVAQSLADLPPIAAGRFFVAGAHGLNRAPRSAIRLHIEAGLAFGTGHHETTSGCLLALDMLARRQRFSRVLDLGCGTGVLAMAAAKLLRGPVTSSDIDPVAVRVARENARRNGLTAHVRPVIAAGFGHPALAAAAPYDLVLANILARPLMLLAHPMARHLAPGGYVILAGLLRSQEAAVRGAYRSQGLFLAQRLLRNEWSVLILHKPKSG